MYRIGAACGFLAALVIVAVAPAGQPGHGLATASGMVEKVDKESLAIQTRGPGGKFAKPVVLKITGTSKITVVSEEKRGGKVVPVQREVDVKDLETKQEISVIYLVAGNDLTLLSGVVRRDSGKK